LHNCFICSVQSEYEEGQFGYYVDGWISLQFSKITNGIIRWHKLHFCKSCRPDLKFIMDKLNEREKENA